MIAIKRVYEKADRADGLRVLVDRIWPRGLTKEKAKIDEWLKDIAPSTELRRWFGHKSERWAEFQRRYQAELASPDARDVLERLRQLARKEKVTLLYGARNEAQNNARSLQSILGGLS
jgi:uncharacterized protein YeaO (DUF488 family)